MVRDSLDQGAGFARLAIGGGTPTFLGARRLQQLFDIVRGIGADPAQLATSVEASPDTLDADTVTVLRQQGVARLSLGVQSFLADELRAVGRDADTARLAAAVALARQSGAATVNLDLICGLPGQTLPSFAASLQACVQQRPEELFVYPLYARPLTGLDRPAHGADIRGAAMALARTTLLAAGYVQHSLRCFRLAAAPPAAGPAYCCQSDGMIGLGIGARSYTGSVHYADDYAVRQRSIRARIAAWSAQADQDFAVARFGIQLDVDDQRRRFVLQSLLQTTGLDLQAYQDRFGGRVFDHLPQLRQLTRLGLAECDGGRLCLDAAGLAAADAIGPWLYSPRVRQLMEGHAWA